MSRTNQQHAVVVGSGFGGMATAIRLRAGGYRVTLVEALEQLGGRAGVWHRDGHVFDAGPTVITAPYLFDELFEMVGRRSSDYFKLKPVDPFYRVDYADGTHFDYVGDEDRLLAQIAELSPRDVDGYRKLAAHAKRIFDIGYTELADAPFTKLSDMMRVVPDMIKLQNYRSVYGLVSRYIHDERLRQAFSFQPLLVGGSPFRTSSIYMLIHWLERKWGVHYAVGGTTSIVNGMGRLMEEIGIDVRLNSPVTTIEVSGGEAKAVQIGSDQRIEADLVVFNGDPSTAYEKLIDTQWRKKHTDLRVNNRSQSMSLFVAYFGTNRRYEDVKHHTIILGNRYEDLLKDIFQRKTLADDFSLYLHRPTASDPSVAPAGKETFYVLSPVPNQLSGVDWLSMHQEYLDKVIDQLEKRALPGLRDSLTTCFAVDPRYFESRLQSKHGNAFGIEPNLRQSAYFRYHNEAENIGGLYFVGAGTHPGAGVPGVLSSAKVVEKLVPALPDSMRIPVPQIRRATHADMRRSA